MDRPKLSIFQQDWWLKRARGSARLREVQVRGANGDVVGGLTYIIQRNIIGIKTATSPHLSRIGGPILGNDLSDTEKSRVLDRLIEKLPNISLNFSISEHMPNSLVIRWAFERAGFECLEQINYSQPPDELLKFGAKLREHIKQASSKLDFVDIDPDKFINFYQNNLKSTEHKRSYFPFTVAKDLIHVSMNRIPPQARIIAVSRKNQKSVYEQLVEAAICIVWDSERCYYWLSTRRNNSHPDAIKLLIYSAMKHAHKLRLVFDADGANTLGNQWLFKTIFGMRNEEKRYIFIRTSKLSELYDSQRATIDKIKRFMTQISLLD
jgi:hypothetical protein